MMETIDARKEFLYQKIIFYLQYFLRLKFIFLFDYIFFMHICQLAFFILCFFVIYDSLDIIPSIFYFHSQNSYFPSDDEAAIKEFDISEGQTYGN